MLIITSKKIVCLIIGIVSFVLCGETSLFSLSINKQKVSAVKVSSKNNFSDKIHYILKKYEQTLFGKPHLFYPAKNPKRLLITFASRTKSYSMCSWYWRDEEDWRDTAYLFLRDETQSWYLGNDENDLVKDFSNLINYYITVCKLTNEKVFAIGGSKGGYAALFYATILGLKGVIAVNPQVNKTSNEITRWDLDRMGKRWQDLDKVFESSPNVPMVLLAYGHYPRDIAAGNDLLNVLKEKSPMAIIRRHPSFDHKTSTVLMFSQKFVENAINYFEKLQPFPINIDNTKGFTAIMNADF